MMMDDVNYKQSLLQTNKISVLRLFQFHTKLNANSRIQARLESTCAATKSSKK